MTGPDQHPVTPARPGLSTVASVLAIAACVPLALFLFPVGGFTGNQANRLTDDLWLDAGQQALAVYTIVGVACAVAPVAAWLARLLPPWVILLAGLLGVTAGYWQAGYVDSAGRLYLVRGLEAGGAAVLLAATAALVGAATARTRPYLAATWAAALLAVGVLRGRFLLGSAPPDEPFGWRRSLEPYPWLLVTASVCGLVLAAASVADRRQRLFPRSIDLAALLPLLPGVAVALLGWTLYLRASWGAIAVLLGAVLLATIGLTGLAAVVLMRAPLPAYRERGAVGCATAAVTFAAAPAALVAASWLLELRAAAAESVAVPAPGFADGLVIPAAVLGVLGAVAGGLLPDSRRRAAMLAGLLAAAAGALALIPAGPGAATALPGFGLLALGCGLALGAVLRSVGPLATAVAGALVPIALVGMGLFHLAVEFWRGTVQERTVPASGPAATGAALHARHVAIDQTGTWLFAVVAVLLVGAAAAVAITVRPDRAATPPPPPLPPPLPEPAGAGVPE